MNYLGSCEGAYLFGDKFEQRRTQVFAGLGAGHQADIGIDALAFDVMGVADNSGFRNSRVQYQRALYLCRSKSVPGNVDYVIDAPGNPIEAILVPARTIAGEIVTGVGGEVSFDAALMVAVNAANLTWPAIAEHQVSGCCAFYFVAIGIQKSSLHAKEGCRCRARFEIGYARDWRDHDRPGFCLPPRIDDRAARIAYYVVIPFPSLWIDWFAYRA